MAYRAKRRGLYAERSWQRFAAHVARVARGLAALGISRGDRVAIMGDACEEWAIADLACQSLGGITYGIYPTASPSELAFQMNDGGASVFVAENQEYVDRILAVIDEIPALRHVVVIDAAALFLLQDPRVLTLDALAERGGATEGAGLGLDAPAPADTECEKLVDWLEARSAEIGADDPAFIVYTSGTTGHPKGALVSHGRHLAGTHNLVAHYPVLAEPGRRTVVYLPPCHVLGRDVAVTLPLIGGLVPHYGESIEGLATTLFDVAPDVLFTVPRYLQKFASQVLTAVAGSSPAKRFVFERALAIGRRRAAARWSGEAASAGARAAYAIAHAAAFGPVLNKLGFDRLRLVLSGGAPLPAETATFWQMLGVNVCEMYGQTETGGAIIAGQRGPYPRPGDVGTAAEGIEIAIAGGGSPDVGGEILVRSDWLFDGYWRQPDATAALYDGAWLRTGDVGRLEDGRLRLVDRARDFIVTAGGKTLSPTAIENATRGSTYVAEVVAFGHGRKYVTALVEIDYDAVAEWARTQGIVHAGFASLVGNPRIVALVQAEIDRANESLARVEQIKKFRILPKTLDPEEEGEPVTPTRKVKRAQMYERFAELVESMYGHEEEELLQRAVRS